MASLSALLRLLLPLLLALLPGPAPFAQGQPSATTAGKRYALVIGNAKYPTAPLKNPVNDARAMARSLKELGFEVTLRENAGLRDMAAAIRQFGASITPGSTALFYFAGHGMQVKGRNFLVPVDADIQLEDEVPYSTVDVGLMLDKLETGKSATNIVILDACRNNPFARRFRSSAAGLAQMDAPIGTLIAFATAPGSVAQDGAGENGVYTRHLLENIVTPGLPVEQMFKRVRIGVTKDTHDAQIPWESSSMKGDFVFREAQAAAQDKRLEEAVRAAAERAATLTAERIAREQAARQPQDDKARAEQAALAAEREKLLRERERLAAENEALRKQAAARPAPVALAAPAVPAAAVAPAKDRPSGAGGALPAVGDWWTYRYSDGYGRTEAYTVRVTAASAEGIRDEAVLGKARHAEQHEPGLELSSRALGGLAVREFAPYLQALGPAEPGEAWKNIQVPGGIGAFTAKAAGRETVSVPAGRFDAEKIVIEGQHVVRGVQTRPLTIQAWYAPAAKRFVRLSFSSPGMFVGVGADKDVIELVETSLPLGATAAELAGKAPAKVQVAGLSPVAGGHPLPRVGDSWTYSYSDKVYGKSASYSVKVTAASAEEIADEAAIGRARHPASFDRALALVDRKLGNLSLRELSPYLLSHGPLRERPEWKEARIPDSSFNARYAGTETVVVPAGTFEAEKLVLEGLKHAPTARSNFIMTVWYAPAAKRFVRLETSVAGNIMIPREHEVFELTGYQLQ